MNLTDGAKMRATDFRLLTENPLQGSSARSVTFGNNLYKTLGELGPSEKESLCGGIWIH